MLKRIGLLLTLLLVLAPGLGARAPLVLAQTTSLEDGPYVIWKGEEAQVYRVRRGKVEQETHRGPFLLSVPGVSNLGLVVRPQPMPLPQEEFPEPTRIFALSDIHGQFENALRLLQAQGVVDRAQRWTFGRGHLVIVGDTLDRGPGVTEAYWYFRALETQALGAGGRVHLLLGNHELMVLGGDYGYFHPKYSPPPAGLPPPQVLYGQDSDMARWLRTRPTLLRLGGFLFVHGGISPAFLARGLDLPRANRLIREGLGLKPAPGTLTHLLFNEQGPLWYRGFLPESGTTSSDIEIDRALAALKARAFVVGHTTQEHITAFHGGRVYAIDAGLKDGRPGEGWLWKQGQAFRALANGRLEPLPPR